MQGISRVVSKRVQVGVGRGIRRIVSSHILKEETQRYRRTIGYLISPISA
jgi:hypothetical protein